MSGTALFATVCAGVVLGTLASAGLAHVRHPRTLQDTVRAHRLLPASLAQAAGRLLGPVELGMGGGGLAAVLTRSSGWATLLLLGSTALYALYTAYAVALVRLRPTLPCGCGAGGRAATNWTVGRNAVYLTVGITAFALRGEVAAFEGSFSGPVFSVVAAAALAILVWTVPIAAEPPALRGALYLEGREST